MISTPTGLLALSKDLVDANTVDRLYGTVTRHMVSVSSTTYVRGLSEGKVRKISINLGSVKNIIDTSRELIRVRDEEVGGAHVADFRAN